MTTLETAPRIALDEAATTFIATFMTHVATLTKYERTRVATLAGIKILLLGAMERGEGDASSEWRALYRAIADLVDTSICAYDTRTAYTYFRDFIGENGDLADA